MTEEKIIKDAQYRKGLSIAWFNATNSAIALTTPLMKEWQELDTVKNKVVEIRNWLLEEHKNYYATHISPIGKIYNTETTIKKLKEATNMKELRLVWISISADERADGDIIKVHKELKEKYKQ